MKNKKMLYVLIPAVLLVWGMIIYKIVSPVSGGDNITGLQNNQFALSSTTEILNDTFSINPNYRDPFLGKTTKKSNPSENKESNADIDPIKKNTATSTKWPSLIYGGMIKNQKSNKQLVLIQINGQSSSIKLGEVINGIELIKIFRDSIEVRFGKENKFVGK
jgi:hypothetical protein